MIDLHCHILPGLDDGARDLSEALEMARIAVGDGISEIVATPHTEDGYHHNRGEEVRDAVSVFQASLAEHGIPLVLFPGAEVHIHINLIEQLIQREVLTLCDQQKYLLLELPSVFLPHYSDSVIKGLLAEGITPLIAHPERNEYLRKQQNQLQAWIHQGARVQVNAGSLLGHWGKQTQMNAIGLLRRGWVHVVASDGHRMNVRQPLLSTAYQMIAKTVSALACHQLQENAKKVLHGEPCVSIHSETRMKWWFFNRYRNQ